MLYNLFCAWFPASTELIARICQGWEWSLLNTICFPSVKSRGRKNFIFGLDFYLKKWSRSRVVILLQWKFIDCHSIRRGFPNLLLTDPLKIFFTYIYVDVFECRRQHLLTDLFWSRQPCTCLTRRACWPFSGAGRPSTSAPPAARSIRVCTTKIIKIWQS